MRRMSAMRRVGFSGDSSSTAATSGLSSSALATDPRSEVSQKTASIPNLERPRARLSVLPYTLPSRSASPCRSSARSKVLMAAMPEEKTREPMVGSFSPAARAFSTTWCASSCSITRSRYAVVGLPRRV
jgi:hypothetical protein